MKVYIMAMALVMSQTNAIRFISEEDESPKNNCSSVSLLKNLVNTSPAMGNI